MMRLIVNADDFGMTPGVSEGILAAHRHGVVTSTTVIVNRPLPRDLVARLRGSGLGIGLHVNLTLGVPLTKAESLTDSSGRLVRDAGRAARRANPRDVETEIHAQVDTFMELFGGGPTHLDTHHHVGLFSPVREVVLRLAVALGVPVRSQTAMARAAARSAGLATPDHFFGGSGPDAYWTPERTLGHLRRLPPGCSEFMTHPGYWDDELRDSRYGRQRETELIGLGSPVARGAALALGIHLCDFRGLA